MIDLLVQLFRVYVHKKDPPDTLSCEYDSEDNPFIQLEWFSGKIKTYGYTRERWDAIWKEFNEYWRKIEEMEDQQKNDFS